MNQAHKGMRNFYQLKIEMNNQSLHNPKLLRVNNSNFDLIMSHKRHVSTLPEEPTGIRSILKLPSVNTHKKNVKNIFKCQKPSDYYHPKSLWQENRDLNDKKSSSRRPSRDLKYFFSLDLPDPVKRRSEESVKLPNLSKPLRRKVNFRSSIDLIDIHDNFKTEPQTIPLQDYSTPKPKAKSRQQKLIESIFGQKQPKDDIRVLLIKPTLQ